jgi:hypothetical protein
MKLLRLRGILFALTLAAMSCAPQPRSVVPSVKLAQTAKVDVSQLVPADLSYAKDFVQFLSDSGWSVQGVHRSKFESFFRETNKAAYLETERGIFEVVFFDQDADVEQIRVSEEQGASANHHKYTVQTPKTNRRIEGGVCYFTKRRKMFIITSDRELNDALDRLLA